MEYYQLKPREAMLAIEYVKDCDLMRAARCTNHSLEEAQELMARPDFKTALDGMIQQIQENAGIDKEWLLTEAADNHRIARATGNLGASNTALKIIGQHQHVDAFAAEKVEISTDKELMERLLRGRQRAHSKNTTEQPGPSFL